MLQEEYIRGDYKFRTDDDLYTKMLNHETKKMKNIKLIFWVVYFLFLFVTLFIV